MKKIRFVVFGVLVVLALVVVAAAVLLKPAPTGTITLNFNNLADTHGITLHLNGQNLTASPISQLQQQYTVPSGNYTITADKPAYKQFETTFWLGKDSAVVINIQLQLSAPPTSITSLTQVITTSNTTVADNVATNATIQQLQYFDDQTWAFIVIDTQIGIGEEYDIAQYRPDSKTWVSIVGPSEDLDSDTLSSAPVDVQTYINNNYAGIVGS